MSEVIGRREIVDALARIRDFVRLTPVLELEPGTLGVDVPVTLKLEHSQVTGSFKARGAFNNLLSVERLPEAGVVAASGGNHGAAVAWAAMALGARAVIFVPEAIANPVKIARMESFGAEVRVVGGTVGEVMAAYQAHAEEKGALAVHPYDTAPTLAGQGTVAAELEGQAPDIDTLFVSVGGGGLIGGIAAWYGERVKVVAVETEGTATYARALREGPGGDMRASGIAASALGAPAIGAMPWAILSAQERPSVVVSDADVIAAQRLLWETTRIVGEPGAAVALAALTSGAYVPEPGERCAVLLCGGNAEPGWFLR
ncbi:threonine dehydratase [Meinhardsimonia xiamenensis]|jgi:threonine dehydratase|uniref:Threonine dehydratase n=1 Tax=Meinhardsimonia xiamenensis TaxID=990712 RepID=A0A1G9CWZ8_9RHOB|nr:threonine/serine dehydratase [Meinhardsimonia xiamenensis]PRX38213.1 threonine dehydratase [Meinhardsimonia xiamenensis]SDK56216.1 threonine dehydratase [Meinhardsimonia xiamenensis]